jgi:hypothetical protein
MLAAEADDGVETERNKTKEYTNFTVVVANRLTCSGRSATDGQEPERETSESDFVPLGLI